MGDDERSTNEHSESTQGNITFATFSHPELTQNYFLRFECFATKSIVFYCLKNWLVFNCCASKQCWDTSFSLSLSQSLSVSLFLSLSLSFSLILPLSLSFPLFLSLSLPFSLFLSLSSSFSLFLVLSLSLIHFLSLSPKILRFSGSGIEGSRKLCHPEST